MNDEFVIIKDFPQYAINTKGQVKNLQTGYIRKNSPSKRGYPVVSLRKDGKTYLRPIHRLLALAFIPNPQNYEQINHIDGDKNNYSLSNLEWCDAKYNNLHARLTGLHKSDGDKPVIMLKNGNVIAEYVSASEAGRANGINRTNICSVCNHAKTQRGHRIKTAGGYEWRWKRKT